MSDYQDDDLSSELSAAVAQITDSAGVPDDADDSTAVPNALADQVEDYQEYAERRDDHLAEQPGDDDEGEQVEQQPQGKRNVPLGALQEERAKRQTAQAQAAELQQQLAAVQAQLQQFQQWQAQQQQAEQQAAVPEFNDDPEGHIKALTEQFRQEIANLQGQHQQAQYTAQFHAQAADAVAYAGQAEEAFRASNPDYDAAYAHVNASAMEQIRAMYPQASEAELQQVQKGALFSFVQHCRANGLNPCEQVFAKAQALGFQPSRRAPAKRPPTSLSTIPAAGKAPDQRGALNVKAVAAMSTEEFDALWKDMERSSTQVPWA